MSPSKLPTLSAHFATRQPSPIRLAQIEFMKRTDGVTAINTAIGNVTLPMHPAMQQRMFNLAAASSPFVDGVDKYTATVGEPETIAAFLNIIRSSGFSTDGLHVQITDGGSQAMELILLGVSDPVHEADRPLLVIDPAYSNYSSMAARTARRTVSVRRKLLPDGTFELPDFAEIERLIAAEKPNAILIIPYDNPTGQFFPQETINRFAQLCVTHNLWLISDEAYRELYYTDDQVSSIWGVTEAAVPGITGRRISLESASKVWNACGLRIGAIISDNQQFITRSVAENTANLCPNAIGQYIFGALAEQTTVQLQQWYRQQRKYYQQLASELHTSLKKLQPKLIVSTPAAAIYSVVDVRDVVKPGFVMSEFVMYCAQRGKIELDGKALTLLVSPMNGFYFGSGKNPGETQLRIAYVAPPDQMKLVPELLVRLLEEFTSTSTTNG